MTPSITRYGFEWGPVKVTRLAHIKISEKRQSYCVDVNGVEVYVSGKGRSVRVFRDGKELK